MRLYAFSAVPSEPLARELAAKALRHAVWLAAYHAQLLNLHEVTHRLCTTLVEVDELLATYDEDAHG
jgi:hypothetical protein